MEVFDRIAVDPKVCGGNHASGTFVSLRRACRDFSLPGEPGNHPEGAPYHEHIEVCRLLAEEETVGVAQ